MKKLILPIGICILVIFSSLTINVEAQPTVRLPSQTVTMRTVYAPNSWFIMTLSNIPAGYDVTNGQYPGWCVEVATNMTPDVNHNVKLYSSYDPGMPSIFNTYDNWDKVNYIINNDEGLSRHTIQEVIWYFICNDPLPVNNSDAQNLAADANASGDGFVPVYGQKIAILAAVVNSPYLVQRTFFEFTLRSAVQLGDLVWNDLDHDGTQDAGEPGLQGITVRLLNESGATIDTAITNSYGYYSFSGHNESNYTLQFVIKSSTWRFSPPHKAGVNDSLDSDANVTTGKTPLITAFVPGIDDMTWDAGMYEVEEPGDPGDPGTTPPPPETPNQAPTADGSAGEPYMILFDQQPIRFNGSRSHDNDVTGGMIVTWLWKFGDGTTSNGAIVTHNYTSPGNYSVTLTVTDNDGATDNYTTNAHIRLPNQPPLAPTLTGSETGSTDESYLLRLVTTDPNGDNVQYTVSWGDGMQNTSALLNSGQNTQILHRWVTWGFYTIQAYAEDDFANAASNISRLVVAVDVLYVGTNGYLIDTDSNGEYDAFFSNSTGTQTTAQRQQTGVYLIDTNGDDKFDLQYDPSTNAARAYPEALAPSYTMLLVGLVVVILVVLIIAFLVRHRWKKP
jgi:PKD repeat protein